MPLGFGNRISCGTTCGHHKFKAVNNELVGQNCKKSNYHSDGLHGKEDSPKEERHPLEAADGVSFPDVRHVVKHIVENDAKADNCDTVGDCRQGSQEFQAPHPVDNNQRGEEAEHVQPHIHLPSCVLVHNLKNMIL